MLRFLPTRALPLRLAAGLAGSAILGLATPAPATELDPWRGIVVITPTPAASPYEAAQQAADAADAGDAVAGSDTPADAVVAPFDPAKETAVMPSLWDSIELGLGDMPTEPEPEAPTPYQLIPTRKAAVQRKRTPLPTSMDLRQGAASLSVTSSASTTAPASGALSTTTTSGSGEITGRVGLQQDNLTVYSTGTLGASAGASPSSASLYDNMAVGSTYSVPLGLGSEKLGASVELDNSQTVTTGVELRAPAGSYQRFISVERSAGPDSETSGIVKAGVLGNF